MPHASAKPVASEGVRPNVPEWLAALGIQRGEYYLETKAAAKRIQQDAPWPYKARVFMALRLHTMAFQGEESVKMIKGGAIVPFSPQDIANATGLSRQHVRRALRELAAEGYCRVEGLHKGKIRIYCYAVPRARVEKNFVAIYGYKVAQPLSYLERTALRFAGITSKDLRTLNGNSDTFFAVLNDCKNRLEAVLSGCKPDLEAA